MLLVAQRGQGSDCVVTDGCNLRWLPNAEFMQTCRAVGLGFVVMGFIGYFVKLIHIPINHVVSCGKAGKTADGRRSVMTLLWRKPAALSLNEMLRPPSCTLLSPVHQLV